MTQCLFVVVLTLERPREGGGGGQMDPHRFFGPKI